MIKETSELISVVMSCYNEKIEWIKKSIESVLNQSYSNIEFIIVCDNPKYDELKKVLVEYKENDNRIKLILNEENKGLTACLNLALEQCNGKYIARMDADDISHIDRFLKQLEYLRNKNVDLVMSGAYFIDENETVINDTTKEEINYENFKKHLMYKNTSIHPTWMFRKEMLNTLEKYNDILYAEDYDFLCRIILNGYKVEYIPECLIDYRVRSEGITKSKRYYQEITSQAISKSYCKALKYGDEYNPSAIIENLSAKEIEDFRIHNEEFKLGKELIKKNSVIKGGIKIFEVLLKSPIKRQQAINHIRFKLIN